MEPDTNKTRSQPSHPPYTDLPPGPPPEDRVMTLVSRNLTPTPVVYEKQLLIWQPENPGDSVTVTIPPGLCVGGYSGPMSPPPMISLLYAPLRSKTVCLTTNRGNIPIVSQVQPWPPTLMYLLSGV